MSTTQNIANSPLNTKATDKTMFEFDTRGQLAAKLTCWHRLTEKESDELVTLWDALTTERYEPQDQLYAAAGAEPVTTELAGVAEALKEGGGIWMTCTGCNESNEGHPTGPFSALMKCTLGGGCSECGGIGAVWDTTDYEEMAEFMARDLRVSASATRTFDLVAHLHRQIAFSQRTFGPGERTAGVLDHIRKELIEIEAVPADLTEWVDLILLAFDGAWRAGHTAEAIAQGINAKQTKNEARTWPDWRTAAPGKAIEHVRT